MDWVTLSVRSSLGVLSKMKERYPADSGQSDPSICGFSVRFELAHHPYIGKTHRARRGTCQSQPEELFWTKRVRRVPRPMTEEKRRVTARYRPGGDRRIREDDRAAVIRRRLCPACAVPKPDADSLPLVLSAVWRMVERAADALFPRRKPIV